MSDLLNSYTFFLSFLYSVTCTWPSQDEKAGIKKYYIFLWQSYNWSYVALSVCLIHPVMVLLGSEKAPENCTVTITAFLQKQQKQMLFQQFSCSHCSESLPTALGAWGKEGSGFIFFPYRLHPGVIEPWSEIFNLNSSVLGCCHWQENMSRTPGNLVFFHVYLVCLWESQAPQESVPKLALSLWEEDSASLPVSCLPW